MLKILKKNNSARSEICRFKVVLLGDTYVGKSSLVTRFVGERFNPYEGGTLGAAYVTHALCLDNMTIRLDFWDTAGQEQFQSLVKLYYRNAEAAIVVYDITKDITFEGAKKWINELRNDLGFHIPIALAGNKQDLDKRRMVESDEAQAFADENELIFMETSAKTMVNVNEIFLAIAKKLPVKKGQSGDCDKGVRLTRCDEATKTSGNCCK